MFKGYLLRIIALALFVALTSIQAHAMNGSAAQDALTAPPPPFQISLPHLLSSMSR